MMHLPSLGKTYKAAAAEMKVLNIAKFVWLFTKALRSCSSDHHPHHMAEVGNVGDRNFYSLQ